MLQGHSAVIIGQLAKEILTTDVYAYGPDGWLNKGKGRASFSDAIIQEFRRRGGYVHERDLDILEDIHKLLKPGKGVSTL